MCRSAPANAVFGGNDFGNYRPARIDGAKYEDMNADGDRDARRSGSPRLDDHARAAGRRSRLSRSRTAPAHYAFTGLRPGTYTVAEQLKPGWRYSAPSDGSRTITVRSGDAATADFGNYRPATIRA